MYTAATDRVVCFATKSDEIAETHSITPSLPHLQTHPQPGLSVSFEAGLNEVCAIST